MVIEESQTRAIADAIALLSRPPGRMTLGQALDWLEAEIDEKGLDVLSPGMNNGFFSRPRRQELLAAVSRLRGARFEAQGGDAEAKRPKVGGGSAAQDGW